MSDDELPVGAAVAGWTPREPPAHPSLSGTYCRLEPLEARHAASLYRAWIDPAAAADWLYLPYDPPRSEADAARWLTGLAGKDSFFAVLDPTSGNATGVAAYIRIDPGNGVTEIAHLNFTRALMRTPAATEAIFLLLGHAFHTLGYRRVEWKCDSLNARSRSAAERYGFVFEGIFRQAVVYKGRNRDTAWYAIIDKDWPRLRAAFETWLAPQNFAPSGMQKVSLRALTRAPHD